MNRLRFLSAWLGVPVGGGKTRSFFEGEVAHLDDDLYARLAGLRKSDGTLIAVPAGTGDTVRCLPCQRDFASDETGQHRAFYHTELVEVPCEFCDRLFANDIALNTHQGHMHPEELQDETRNNDDGRTTATTDDRTGAGEEGPWAGDTAEGPDRRCATG